MHLFRSYNACVCSWLLSIVYSSLLFRGPTALSLYLCHIIILCLVNIKIICPMQICVFYVVRLKCCKKFNGMTSLLSSVSIKLCSLHRVLLVCVRCNLTVHCSVTSFIIQQPIRRPYLLERVYKPMHTLHQHEETCRAQNLEILT